MTEGRVSRAPPKKNKNFLAARSGSARMSLRGIELKDIGDGKLPVPSMSASSAAPNSEIMQPTHSIPPDDLMSLECAETLQNLLRPPNCTDGDTWGVVRAINEMHRCCAPPPRPPAALPLPRIGSLTNPIINQVNLCVLMHCGDAGSCALSERRPKNKKKKKEGGKR